MNKIVVFLSLLISATAFAQSETEVVNIENAAVEAYLSDNTYLRDSSMAISVVDRYTDKQKYGDIYNPQGKIVTWTPTAPAEEIAGICVTVSTKEDYSNSQTFFASKVTDCELKVRNLLPNMTYYYKVEQSLTTGQVTELKHGTFRTKGQLRMIHATGGFNIRDIGGWPSTLVPGGHLRYGLMYRGGNLDKVKAEGVHELVDNLHIGAELDLRGESKLTSSALGSRVNFIKIVTGSYSPSGQGNNYARDLRWLIEQLKAGKSVYWHCAVGCDRCGTLSFLIEGLLGVDEVNLSRDYELSCFRGFKRQRTKDAFRKLIPWMKKNYPRPTLAQSFYDYWLNYGMTREELDYLRKLMVGTSDASDDPKGPYYKYVEYLYHE